MNFKQFFEAKVTQPINNWQEMLSQDPYLATAVDLLDKIETLGHGEALITGGAVRDILLKQKAHDIDITTNVDVVTLEHFFKTHDIGKSKEFGIVTLKWGDYWYEVANYRSEQGYSDNRRPDQVTKVQSFEQDSERRDITFNALALDKHGTIIDYQDGLKDLKKGIVKAVGNAKQRFMEDSLRILRVARFAAKLGFKIDPDTRAAMIELSSTVDNVSRERVHDELFKVSTSGDALANYLEYLDDIGLLERLLPEVKELQRHTHYIMHHPEGAKAISLATGIAEPFDVSNPEHQDPTKYQQQRSTVYDHLLAVLRASQSNDPVTNQALLFHDIGKPATAKPITKNGQEGESFHGHEYAGVDVFRKIASRLKYSNEEKAAIIFAMEHHMWGHQIKTLAKSKVLKMRQSPYWDVLRHTMRADDASRGKPLWDPEAFEDRMDYVERLYKAFGETQEFERRMSGLINGNIIMQLVPTAKGAEIGRIKTAVRDWIVSRDFKVEPEEVEAYVKSIA